MGRSQGVGTDFLKIPKFSQKMFQGGGGAIYYKNFRKILCTKYLHLPSCGRYKQRIGFFMSTALPISYPTPREGWVTSATMSGNFKQENN